MDPNFITASDWDTIGDFLLFLFGVPTFVILFAFSLLFARAIVPSLVGTGHLPERVLRLLPLFYGSAFIGLGFLVWVFFSLVDRSDVIENFYFRWWI